MSSDERLEEYMKKRLDAQRVEGNLRVTMAELKLLLARDRYAVALFLSVAAERRVDDLKRESGVE